MRRLIEMLTLVVFSLLHNVSYVPVQEKPFTDDYVYSNDDSTHVSYHDLYQEFFKSDMSKDGCIDTPYKPTTGDVTTPSEVTGYKWFIPGEKWKSGKKYKFKSNGQVVAPCNCKVANSAAASSNSTLLELVTDSGYYKIVFSNLKCWFCCSKRDEPIDGVYVHTKDVKGVTIPEGYVCGISTKNTTVKIYRRSENSTAYTEEVSLDDWFSGKVD